MTSDIQVGYTSPFSTTEFGIFADLTEKGLGFRLLGVGSTYAVAFHAAKRNSLFGCEKILRVRTVTYQPWREASLEDRERSTE